MIKRYLGIGIIALAVLGITAGALLYVVAFDYDLREYTVNGKEAKPLPEDIEAITVVVERT